MRENAILKIIYSVDQTRLFVDTSSRHPSQQQLQILAGVAQASDTLEEWREGLVEH